MRIPIDMTGRYVAGRYGLRGADVVFPNGVLIGQQRWPGKRTKKHPRGEPSGSYDYAPCLAARYDPKGYGVPGEWICTEPGGELCRRESFGKASSTWPAFDNHCPAVPLSRLTTFVELETGSPKLVPAVPAGLPDWTTIDAAKAAAAKAARDAAAATAAAYEAEDAAVFRGQATKYLGVGIAAAGLLLLLIGSRR